MESERLLDRREMALLLGVSVATLDRMRVVDGCPSYTLGRRTRRFKPSEVIAWAKARRAA
jgi:predicted DNA-binding transcriptional regulator AlpA